MKSEAPLTVLLLAILVMMVLPLPTLVVDAMIGLNLSVAVLLIVTVLHLHSPLSLTAFPAILLMTTLFRLALSISTTRLILLDGDAGMIVETFGRFVVGGNVVVGMIVFLILTIVQFIVVTKGAERVAEVGARFSLDALPGKQMAIDGDMRAGLIDGEEAGRRRESLGRESQFYGAMDGAMKFVKGDAIAGLVICVVNLLGGVAVGAGQRGLSLGEAGAIYSILTIGDGLVSQIPSLLISIAAGIVVTRVAGPGGATSTGQDIVRQLVADPRALQIAGGGVALLGLTPGLPGPVFALLGCALFALAFAARRRGAASAAGRLGPREHGGGPAGRDAGAADTDADGPFTVPLACRCSTELIAHHGAAAIAAALERARGAVQAESGVPVPAIVLRREAALAPFAYRFEHDEVPVARGSAAPGVALVVSDTLMRLDGLGIAYEPVSLEGVPRPAAHVPEAVAVDLAQLGDRVYRGLERVTLHLECALRMRVGQLIGMQETHELLAQLEQRYPELVQELQRLLPEQRVSEVLQRLAAEHVSVRNLRAIAEALVQWAPREKDVVVLTEYVRLALGAQIGHQWLDANGAIPCYLLAMEIEDLIREAIRQTSGGNYLALDPDTSGEIVAAAARCLRAEHGDMRPVILAPMEIRRYLRKVLEIEFPHVPVLAYQEIPVDIEVDTLGRIELPATAGRRGAANRNENQNQNQNDGRGENHDGLGAIRDAG
ncbi:type III secretion system export apparatus subunit SctV [Robbsia betulipollinis]|uniref:type III secretion system export apparatus subunit SctV n=1 Tax=Robbsia betulipollinis TaxID=2981849 RepID=UPI0025463EA5|nr:type III secretion system export apparatus subunit SctV [Robbsia betulipollinis]